MTSGAEWVAFFPPEPATLGHALIIPRMHVPDFWTADQDVTDAITRAAHHLGRVTQRTLAADGMNLITSAGTAAQQTVFHLHVHLVPRWHDDSFGTIWPPKGLVPPDEVAIALERMRRACDA